jgi:hypothetical protein
MRTVRPEFVSSPLNLLDWQVFICFAIFVLDAVVISDLNWPVHAVGDRSAVNCSLIG